MGIARNPYGLLGLGLALWGLLSVPVFYFLLRSTPLTALGISLIVLGVISLGLARTRPEISPEVALILVQVGADNIAALVEELGLTSKAVYLPSSKTEGRPQALIPLLSNPGLPDIKASLPQRLITRYGPNPEDMGLLVTTPGSATVAMLDSPIGPTSAELESGLSHILVGMLDAADRVRVSRLDNLMTVEVSNPRIENKTTLASQCLGSPLASIVASLAAEALGKPIIIREEQGQRGKRVVALEAVP
jgi:hypothetical protein